ncbi:MAG: hypothetical protein EXS25_00245 [Pedosphaera sp.]|nr:hypothetical protein [Pedosphaera sp.]
MTPIALWSTIGSLTPWTTVRSRRILAVSSVVGWSAMVFLLISEAFFFEEFQSRFNPVAVDYLIFPHEVFVNVWESYPFLRVLFGCLILGTGAALLSLRVTRSVPTPGRNRFAAVI